MHSRRRNRRNCLWCGRLATALSGIRRRGLLFFLLSLPFLLFLLPLHLSLPFLLFLLLLHLSLPLSLPFLLYSIDHSLRTGRYFPFSLMVSFLSRNSLPFPHSTRGGAREALQRGCDGLSLGYVYRHVHFLWFDLRPIRRRRGSRLFFLFWMRRSTWRSPPGGGKTIFCFFFLLVRCCAFHWHRWLVFQFLLLPPSVWRGKGGYRAVCGVFLQDLLSRHDLPMTMGTIPSGMRGRGRRRRRERGGGGGEGIGRGSAGGSRKSISFLLLLLFHFLQCGTLSSWFLFFSFLFFFFFFFFHSLSPASRTSCTSLLWARCFFRGRRSKIISMTPVVVAMPMWSTRSNIGRRGGLLCFASPLPYGVRLAVTRNPIPTTHGAHSSFSLPCLHQRISFPPFFSLTFSPPVGRGRRGEGLFFLPSISGIPRPLSGGRRTSENVGIMRGEGGRRSGRRCRRMVVMTTTTMPMTRAMVRIYMASRMKVTARRRGRRRWNALSRRRGGGVLIEDFYDTMEH